MIQIQIHAKKQMHKHTNTNSQIQKTQTHKYQCTNAQIHKFMQVGIQVNSSVFRNVVHTERRGGEGSA